MRLRFSRIAGRFFRFFITKVKVRKNWQFSVLIMIFHNAQHADQSYRKRVAGDERRLFVESRNHFERGKAKR